MASLSNINGIFDVHSTGAIQFNGNHGTAGQILKSNGNAAPTWVAASTVIGGPYLPLSGGTLTGATATASGISFTVGGALTGTSATFTGNAQAATFNGLAINTTGTNNVANQIVRTEANGYVNFGWINSISGATTSTITRITASNDAYLRYVTPATFRTQITDSYYAPAGTVSGVTSVATGNGLTGGTITSTGTLSMSGSYSGNFVATTLIGPLSDSGYKTITNPSGATYVTNASSVTGAIAITLPIWAYPMIRMTIQVYEYSTNESFTVSCGGHNSDTNWYNPFAYIVGNPVTDRRFTVRFGRTAGGLPVVYIGELASTWSYPQVFVTDVQVGYSSNSNGWTSGWSVGFRTGSFEGVSRTIYNSQVGFQATTNVANSVALRDGSGNFSAGTITAALSGNASTSTTFNTGRTNYYNVTNNAVIGQMMWKNYGNNHTIFDASQSTSPNGGSVNNTNSAVAWSSSYPTLMGWNGSSTYGVRVDSARIADSAANQGNYLPLAGGTMTGALTAKDRISLPASGLSSASGTPAYAIYQTPGAWTHPFPDLNIIMHTGIRMAANSGYGGFRFYSDYNTLGTASAQIMSINNSSDGNGAGNVYINNICNAGDSMRSPIFYDSNNTTYYTNPASNSLMNTITFSGGTLSGTLTMNTQKALVANNYGRGVYGLYSASRFQHLWSMGTAYNLADNGTSPGNLYGVSWSHPNAGGVAANLSNHGMLLLLNGGYQAAISGSIRCVTDMRTPIYYDSNNTGYFGNFASTSVLNALQFNYTQHGSANNIRMGNSTTMNAISSGTNNAAFGVEALGGCSTGSRNFAYGYAALFNLSSGGNNIAMGDATGYNITSGSNNLLFGQNAGRTGYQSPQSIAGITTGSNQIHMGNESHSTARIQISWTVNSDSRDKTDVTPIDVGLDFVKDLNPVTFRWDKRSDYEDRVPTGQNKLQELTLGFLAQEVEEVEKSYGYNVANKTNLVVDRDVDQDHFGITYEKMIPILTKAIQEQQVIIDDLKSRIEKLEL